MRVVITKENFFKMLATFGSALNVYDPQVDAIEVDAEPVWPDEYPDEEKTDDRTI